MGKLPDGIHTVVLGMGDTNGIMRGKRIPARHWPTVVENGMAMANAVFALDMTCDIWDTPYTNFETGYPDIFVVPETDPLPMHWDPGAAFCFGTARTEAGDLVPIDPRNVLVKVTEKAAEMGLEISIGAELEFYLLDPETLRPRDSGIEVYGLERAMELENILGPIRNDLTDAGIPIEQSNPEYAAGQVEVNIRYGEALLTADRVVAFRGMIKQLAVAHGSVATFMSKPFFEESGSGFHVHHSVWRDGVNQFADGGKLSALGRRYLAGMRRYMPETAILSAGTPNAYRRRQPYTFCPTNNTWGYDNRTVGLRVIEGHEHAVRIEQRDGSADINPYYLLASQIAAGLRGVEEELDAGDPELGNGYENTEATALPSNIEMAVAAARDSEFVAELLGPDLLEIWLGQADREIEFLSQQVTPVETARYLRRF